MVTQTQTIYSQLWVSASSFMGSQIKTGSTPFQVVSHLPGTPRSQGAQAEKGRRVGGISPSSPKLSNFGGTDNSHRQNLTQWNPPLALDHQ